MPTLPTQAAAYTRTNILLRFLDELSASPPQRVDAGYASQRLALKGGDIRAFLQSARVLGLIDPYGQLTPRAQRARAQSQRGEAMREALREAYPDLYAEWITHRGLQRTELEDVFKVRYGLSASSAAPAAKLFSDLMRRFGPALPSVAEATASTTAPPTTTEPAVHRSVTIAEPMQAPGGLDTNAQVRLAALEAVKNSLRIDINADWDPDRINLVFDRMERLVQRILEAA